jgi:2-keto-4-pentenoate hydratase/2-oxohepta-3-ene-1,7-dioic acid hydratase in catechol pathway
MAKSFKLAAKFFADLSTLFEDGTHAPPLRLPAPAKGRYHITLHEYLNLLINRSRLICIGYNYRNLGRQTQVEGRREITDEGGSQGC